MVRSKLVGGVIATSVAAILLLPAYTSIYLYPAFTRLLVENTEKEVERAATHLASMFISHHDILGRSPLSDEEKKELNTLLADFGLMKIKIFAPSGEILYSTDPEETGRVNRKRYFHEIVAAGKRYSMLIRKNSPSLEGQTMPADVIETYIPIMKNGRFMGAFEVYYDITSEKGKMERLISRSSSMSYALALALFTATILSAIKAHRNIVRRYNAEEELRRHRDNLEKLVRERTEELVDANRRLSKEIEDRKRMEEELLKAKTLESIGILAGGIAHDFNNLLTVIMGNISFSKMRISPRQEEMTRRLESAEEAAMRARDLVEQLLTFAGRGEPVKKALSVRDLTVNAAGFALSGSSVKSRFELPGNLWPVEADEVQLGQVLHNIILNARESMPAGGVISIRADNVVMEDGNRYQLKRGRYVMIQVRDHGRGIPREHMPRIFDPYFSTKDRGPYKGMGLGLAICYSIMKNHGGAIGVDSREGEGTVVSLYVPASEKEPPRQTCGTTPPASTPHRSGRILIMDDEELVKQVTGDMLMATGFEVDIARDGKEAIRKYEKALADNKPFDAVILDLTIPGGMGGEETLRALLAIDPDARAIVSSGYTNDPVVINYRKYGFMASLPKPYDMGRLQDVLNSVLRVRNRKENQ